MSEQPARILVVDDIAQNVRLLEAVLEAHDYNVVSATDGNAAVELALSANPDLVLLDVLMPPPDGYTVCRRLRAQKETAILPVIMLTASEGSEKTKAIEAGADDFIPKPFNQHELLTRIRSLLRIKRYHDTITKQAAELLDLNRTLEERVQTQLESSRGCNGSAASSPLSSPTPSSPRATSRFCAVTVGRSPCSSPTCAGGRLSSTP
jgi:adenylate cyclase